MEEYFMERSIDDLIENLNSDDEFIIEEAMGLLEMKADEAIDPLISALSSRKKNIKINAAKLLGVLGDPKAIDPLILTLRDNNKLVRREASTSLSRLGAEAVNPLIGILNDEDWRVRGAAAWALGNLNDERAIEPLEALVDDESAFVSSGAKNAIANIKKGV